VPVSGPFDEPRFEDKSGLEFSTDGSPVGFIILGSFSVLVLVFIAVSGVSNGVSDGVSHGVSNWDLLAASLIWFALVGAFLGGVLYAFGWAFAYNATLMSSGDVEFRSLFGRRVIQAAVVESVWVGQGEGGHAWLVLRSDDGKVRFRNTAKGRELTRRLGAANPSIDVDPRILE
jgi:hypothetical protein